MITVHKIQVYNKYGGDEDGMSRSGNEADKDVIRGDEWTKIRDFYQDIHLVSQHLASKEYIEKLKGRLRNHCDQDSYAYFVAKIPFSPK